MASPSASRIVGQTAIATGIFKSILGFANGGDPPVGQISLVGERGPELFIPKTSGTIIPNDQLGGNSGNNGQNQQSMQPIIIANTWNVKAWDAKDVKQYLSENKDMIQSMVAGGIKDNKNGLRNAVRAV